MQFTGMTACYDISYIRETHTIMDGAKNLVESYFWNVDDYSRGVGLDLDDRYRVRERQL